MFFQVVVASEPSSDTIFDNSWTTYVPADSNNPVPLDIIGSQTKMPLGWLAGWQ